MLVLYVDYLVQDNIICIYTYITLYILCPLLLLAADSEVVVVSFLSLLSISRLVSSEDHVNMA